MNLTDLHSGNMSKVIDLITSKQGINAVDEVSDVTLSYAYPLETYSSHFPSFLTCLVVIVTQWGSTPLMMAVSSGHETMVASLLNAWRPRVDVNARKPVRIYISSFRVRQPSPLGLSICV